MKLSELNEQQYKELDYELKEFVCNFVSQLTNEMNTYNYGDLEKYPKAVSLVKELLNQGKI